MGTSTAAATTDRSPGGDGRREAIEGLGRVGFAAKALLYVVVGAVVGRMAFGDASQEASSEGAFDAIASQPLGTWLLALTALGLAFYGLWRLSMTVLGSPRSDDLPAWLVRTSWGVSGLVNLGLAWLAARTVLGSGGSGGTSRDTGALLGLPGGVAMVVVGGLILVAVGIDQGRKAADGDWQRHLDRSAMGPQRHRAAVLAGRIGHGGRCLAFATTGGFLVHSALTYDPDEPVGLDAALRELQATAFGLPVLLAVALGLTAYGAWCASVTLWGEPHE